MRFPVLPLCASPDGQPTAAEAEFLRSIQGGILKGHGRNHQRLVFFRFPRAETPEERRERAVQFLRHSGTRVTSAEQQREQRELWKEAWPADPAKGDDLLGQANRQLFCNLWLTRAGLAVLGLKMDGVTDPPGSFDDGLKTRLGAEIGGDEMAAPPYSQEGTGGDFHGVLLLAGNQRDLLRDAGQEFFQGTEAGRLESDEEITAWRDRTDPYDTDYLPPREPFGFADGISEPLFFHDERIPPAAGRPPEPTAWQWTRIGLDEVFIPAGKFSGGTFVVMLKIEQNVAAFRGHEQAVADWLVAHHGVNQGASAYLAPAILMGRTRQGYPVGEIFNRLAERAPPAWRTALGSDDPGQRGYALKKLLGQLPAKEAELREYFPGSRPPGWLPPSPPTWLNEFDFSGGKDARSPGCPFHAHTRKMNPRAADAVHLREDDAMRAQPVRRGAAYGAPERLEKCASPQPADWPVDGVGLMFIAYMRSLARQFEAAHTHWAPDISFPLPGGGADPVLARLGVGQKFAGQSLPSPNEPTRVLRRLGGVYLFCPPMSWFGENGPPSA